MTGNKRLLLLVSVPMLLVSTAISHADPAENYPELGADCRPEFAGVMTLLPDEETYAVCRDADGGAVWEAAQLPFEPNDTWLSYGPEIALHGQGMRNPNVTSGRWLATPTDPPSDPPTVCRAEQQTVVGAGVLSEPRVSESAEPGADLTLEFLPQLFYLKLSGDCLWTREG